MIIGEFLNIQYWNENNKTFYGCKGFGPEYNDFWSYLYSLKSFKLNSSDFPWAYFQILDKVEEQSMIIRYKNDIYENIQD